MITSPSPVRHASAQTTTLSAESGNKKHEPQFGNIAADTLEVLGNFGSAYGNAISQTWNNGEHGFMNVLGKGISGILIAIAGTPIGGAALYAKHRKTKHEAKNFKKQAEALRHREPEAFITKIDQALSHKNIHIRNYGIRCISDLQIRPNGKFKRYISALNNSNDDLYRLAKHCLGVYLQQQPHDKMEQLLRLAPTFVTKVQTTTTYITVDGILIPQTANIPYQERTAPTPEYLALREEVWHELG